MIHQTVFDRLTARGRSNLHGRCGLAVVFVGLFAITAGAYADDRGTDYPRAAPPPPAASATGQLPRAQSIAVPQTRPDSGRVVDRLYEELMHWAPPACSPTSTLASIASGC
jgi:hypothetical protein